MHWTPVLLIKNILCDEVIELRTIHDRTCMGTSIKKVPTHFWSLKSIFPKVWEASILVRIHVGVEGLPSWLDGWGSSVT